MPPSEILFQGRRFYVVRETQIASDGQPHSREVVRHPGAVVILPLLDDGRVCLIRNFRVSVGKMLVELPAGTLEPGEDPAECATRELTEETGYRAGMIDLLTVFYPSPGILDEKMHLYAARQLKAGQMALEPGEEIVPLKVTWEAALAMTRDGRIQDAKTIAGLLYYHTFFRQIERQEEDFS
jgi:ADP-ribose pyrophosphatase